ncbi:MAG: hypothetical protein BWZ01_03179 [Deltaproteobacteria bacterium ADurb.BinA179]|nr:MAG: hypothetical protein BWZ01_03179 [Deltaproteobacteria bacterium ADurb.BinA179]
MAPTLNMTLKSCTREKIGQNSTWPYVAYMLRTVPDSMDRSSLFSPDTVFIALRASLAAVFSSSLLSTVYTSEYFLAALSDVLRKKKRAIMRSPMICKKTRTPR